ncbi:kynureninase [Marmoricola endophyticus]|uniref:Kynureninase n=1 Tax=Marmoricola endophyticus TaxID=2040280 RepID=A0A917BTK2_9ACTN|nr:kynureninase [Marmoricola endophyticus]GGF55818.1 kynureninase [Marmoricola endophyticus]
MSGRADEAAALDAASPLRTHRERFVVPEGLVYLDGNSLGPLPRAVPAAMTRLLEDQWGTGLIGSWNASGSHPGWMDLPRRVGDLIAPLIGAGAGEVHVGDSTSVSLFKTMVAALRMRPDRRVLVVEPTTFPTDGYVAAGVARLTGAEVRWCDPSDPLAAVDEDVALLSLTHVDFRTGAMYDLPALTAAAHERGALVQWDLCHSTGAVPVDLTGAEADLAVGCGYKYLNGGPGAPAFTWVRPDLVPDLDQPVPGWMGHARPFALEREHVSRTDVGRLASGTPPVLGLTALEAALGVFADVSPTDLRAASLSLSDLFVRLADERLPPASSGLEVVTPREHSRRGSQVSLRHESAYGIVQALIARGVVGDFRAPDLARFGFAPLFVRHTDVLAAVDHLVAVLENGEHLDPAYEVRNTVT